MIPIEAIKQVKRIITHRDCADGTAAAMIAADAIPGAEVVAVAYGPERDALEPGPADLFVDMTPPPAKVDVFVAAGAIVLDHHSGARELCAASSRGLLGQSLFAHRPRRARDIAERGCLRLAPEIAIFNDAPKPDSRISDVAEAHLQRSPLA